MNEILATILNAVSLTLSAGAITYIIYFKERKVKEGGEAIKTKEEAKATIIATFEKELSLLPTMKKAIEELIDKDVKNSKIIGEFAIQIEKLENRVTLEIEKKTFAEKYICELVECQERKPPFGTFSSDNPPVKMAKRAPRKKTVKTEIA